MASAVSVSSAASLHPQSLVAPGGMGGNVATAFARLGGQIRFAGSFSDIEDGEALRRDMESAGIDTALATTRPSRSHERGFITDGRSHRARTFEIVPVDTTGAGDYFAAAYIFATIRGLDLSNAARFASATAACSIAVSAHAAKCQH